MEQEINLSGMQITLMDEAEEKMSTIWLPEGEPKGRYSFEQYGVGGFYIEATNGAWNAVCKDGTVFENCQNDYKYCVPLTHNQFIKITSEENHYALFTEKATDDNMIFHKFAIADGVQQISIGRHGNNDICIDNSMVSGRHAMLTRQGNDWFVVDQDSTNGTFCNCRRVIQTQLLCGDMIYIMGLRIIFGAGFIALNLSGKGVSFNSDKLKPFHNMTINPASPTGERPDVFFNRSPRKRMALKLEEIKVDGPPMGMHDNKMPFLLRSGNSMVSGATALMSGNVASILTSLLFPTLTHNYTEKERKEYEEKRRTLYTNYLNCKQQEILEEKNREENTLRWNYPNLGTVLGFPADGQRFWERKKTDDDFLAIRIGSGEKKLLAPLTYPKEKMSMEEDELENAMRALAERSVRLEDVPIQTSLVEDFVCGVSGDDNAKKEFVRNFILQMVVTHSYDEVKLIFVSDERTLEDFRFVRYLPHVWNDERNFRFIATNSSEAYHIGEYLQKEFDGVTNREFPGKLKECPYYVVVAFDKKCLDAIEVLKNILQEEKNQCVSLIAAFPDLPKECSKIFSMEPNGNHEVLYLKDLDRETEHFRLDICNPQMARVASEIMANTKLKTIEQAYSLPGMLTFLQMLGVGKIEHLNIESRWKNSNPVQTLAAPIGVATDGSLFMLDLHQKYQGPHGLVAGTTGSGKSEFLLTYILSMAVNYHPNEVAFVLIDYKGGGLAGAFDDPEHGIHLPHLVGTITNLDGSAIQRSLISIQSELLRRQRIFNDVKSATGEGTMDIYMYQKAYRNGLVQEPMPHLFIISDEFAELKQQEPEFMAKLVSAARIGRSLGIHLILATQKPSGVVDDQIRSNTKFRACLKVQDKSDSMDMLQRPEAAELKETGRFYLQVGYNEFFALGQSAWSGADYVPNGEVVIKKDEFVQIIDGTGQSLVEAKKKQAKGKKTGSQLVSVVKYISDIAARENIQIKQLWKPAISNYLLYSEMNRKYEYEYKDKVVEAWVGMVDDPENQKQFPMTVDLQNSNNILIIGESGCGKTTFLQSMLYDITKRYSPDKVQYYILDCSNHALRVFRDAPHCGAWVSETQTGDIDRLFRLLDDQIKARKNLFTEADVSSYEMYIRKRPLPLLVYVIDNMAGLTATPKGEDYYCSISAYMKRSAGLGIQFVMSTSHLNELYSKTKQELGVRIALEQKDKYGYMDVLSAKCEYLPAKNKGHGAALFEERVLEFQTAIISTEEQDDEDVKAMIDDVCKDVIPAIPVDKLPTIDENMTYEEFMSKFKKGRLPIGYYVQDVKPVALPFKQMSMLSVYFGNGDGRKPFFENMIAAARQNNMEIIVLKKMDGSCFDKWEDMSGITAIECNRESVYSFLLDMTAKMGPRIQTLQTYTRAHGLKASKKDIYRETYSYMSETVQPILVIFEGFVDLYDTIDGDENDKTLAKLFAISRNLGIYYIAGFYPDESVNSAYELTKAFNPEQVELYLGGQYHRQRLGDIPSQFSKIEKECPYNKGLMHYHNQFYPMFVPCGIIEEKVIAEDDRDIFGA